MNSRLYPTLPRRPTNVAQVITSPSPTQVCRDSATPSHVCYADLRNGSNCHVFISSAHATGRVAYVVGWFFAFSHVSCALARAEETFRPRRHHRRMSDDILEKGTHADDQRRAAERSERQQIRKTEGAQAESRTTGGSKEVAVVNTERQLLDLRRSIKRSYRKLKRAIWGETPVYTVGISARSDPYMAKQLERNARGPSEAWPLGWIPLAVAASLIYFLLFGKQMKWPWRRSSGRTKGRWIRDRSLGGKMVFIPDTTDKASAGPRPLWPDDETFERNLSESIGAVAVSVSRGAVGASESSTSSRAIPSARDEPPPEWWAPPKPASYIPQSRREELARQARQVLRELEDAKIVHGRDYSLAELLRLRGLCHDAGGIQVRPSTESGRDSMIRASVQAALERPGELGTWEPARFVSGLAMDLGVPEKRAITIVHAAVAAACRSALIEAEVGFRAGNEEEILRSLGKMVSNLRSFPLPQGSPEAEMVGRAIQSQTSLEFRRAMFFAAGSSNLTTAPIIAEMLGFDPDLVMPNLLTQMAAADAQAQFRGSNDDGSDDAEDRF